MQQGLPFFYIQSNYGFCIAQLAIRMHLNSWPSIQKRNSQKPKAEPSQEQNKIVPLPSTEQ